MISLLFSFPTKKSWLKTGGNKSVVSSRRSRQPRVRIKGGPYGREEKKEGKKKEEGKRGGGGGRLRTSPMVHEQGANVKGRKEKKGGGGEFAL